MRPALVSVADQIMLKRELDKLRRLTSQGSNNRRGPRGGYARTKDYIRFKNTSSETAPRWGVMRITEGSTEEHLTIAKPDTSFNRLYLVNVGGPVEVNKYGFGTFLTSQSFRFDDQYVLYDTNNTPAIGESWGPQNNTWTLKKWRYGFTIMGANTGTSTEARTIAVQHAVNEFWGQTDAAINKGSSGTVSVFDGNDTDTSINVSSVKNKFANVAITKKVKAHWLGGSWYLDAAEC